MNRSTLAHFKTGGVCVGIIGTVSLALNFPGPAFLFFCGFWMLIAFVALYLGIYVMFSKDGDDSGPPHA